MGERRHQKQCYTYGWDLTKNICEVFANNGYIRTAYTYAPYGSVTSTGNVTQPIQWSREYADSELAMVYYNYRYYNPLTGRRLRRTIITDKDTCTIHIVLPIVISPLRGDNLDDNTMQTMAARIKRSVEEKWSGFPYGCCTVQVTANVSSEKEKVFDSQILPSENQSR